jgi:hypothetical protein
MQVSDERRGRCAPKALSSRTCQNQYPELCFQTRGTIWLLEGIEPGGWLQLIAEPLPDADRLTHVAMLRGKKALKMMKAVG